MLNKNIDTVGITEIWQNGANPWDMGRPGYKICRKERKEWAAGVVLC